MPQSYSVREISQNNGNNGKPVWIIVKNAVYDVTKLLKDHPGGEELILEYAGKDATRAFNDAGHSVDAIRDMKLYKIGIVDNQSSQQCTASAIATTEGKTMSTETAMNEQPYRKEKKRLKLFFCF